MKQLKLDYREQHQLVARTGLESAASRFQVQCSNHSATAAVALKKKRHELLVILLLVPQRGQKLINLGHTQRHGFLFFVIGALDDIHKHSIIGQD